MPILKRQSHRTWMKVSWNHNGICKFKSLQITAQFHVEKSRKRLSTSIMKTYRGFKRIYNCLYPVAFFLVVQSHQEMFLATKHNVYKNTANWSISFKCRTCIFQLSKSWIHCFYQVELTILFVSSNLFK